MEHEILTLQYLNEDDKAYGLAGMAISLGALDALDRVIEVSLDAEGPMVTFSHAYYYYGNQSVSPKATWNNMLHNYYITSAMVLANVLSRSLVRLHSNVDSEILEALHDGIVEEGRNEMSLEDDEIENLYGRTLTSMRRIFNNPRVHPAVEELAGIMARRRRLSASELAETLSMLQIF